MEDDQPQERGRCVSGNAPYLSHKTIEEMIEVAVAFHSNGDIERAAAIYWTVLESAPDNIHANFNLATICHGKGKMEDAIACYRQVLTHDPGNFQVLFYLAGAYRDQGCLDAAVNTYRLAIDSEPEHADAYYNLGGVYQHRDEPENALDCYMRTIELNPVHSPAFYNLGVVCYQIGNYDESVRCYEKALELSPGDVDTYYNLALVQTKKGCLEEGLRLYLCALDLAPDDADIHNSLGLLYKRLKNFADAEKCFRETIRLKPDFGAAYTYLAVTLHSGGNTIEAIECYSKAIELGHQTEAADHMLAALTGSTRTSMPENYVRDLFDSYADGFDVSLVTDLGYNTPVSLIKILRKFSAKRCYYESVLDLGCGTGLAGEAFRGICGRLSGVDISSKMLAKAKQKDIYNTLHCSDITDFLAATDENFDLIIAADVFNYVGALGAVFHHAANCLREKGLFVFSIEKLAGAGGCRLQPSGRYAHSREFVEQSCMESALVIKVCHETDIRKDRGEWIKGQLFVLQRS